MFRIFQAPVCIEMPQTDIDYHAHAKYKSDQIEIMSNLGFGDFLIDCEYMLWTRGSTLFK